MRRIHLFEIEDLASCPQWLRKSVTDMLATVHRWFHTSATIAAELRPLLPPNQDALVLDLCSGSAGPMPDVIRILQESDGATQRPDDGAPIDCDNMRKGTLELVLSDLHPDPAMVDRYAQDGFNDTPSIRYEPVPIDAGNVPRTFTDGDKVVVRTMVCSFHHMPPAIARRILWDVQEKKQPMLIFEISDNTTPPPMLWWATLLPNFVFGVFVSTMTWPMTWTRFFFTFVCPIIPATFAWDGAVSNVRTYNESDFRQLIQDDIDPDYCWEFSTVKGGMVNHLVVKGRPLK